MRDSVTQTLGRVGPNVLSVEFRAVVRLHCGSIEVRPNVAAAADISLRFTRCTVNAN